MSHNVRVLQILSLDGGLDRFQPDSNNPTFFHPTPFFFLLQKGFPHNFHFPCIFWGGARIGFGKEKNQLLKFFFPFPPFYPPYSPSPPIFDQIIFAKKLLFGFEIFFFPLGRGGGWRWGYLPSLFLLSVLRRRVKMRINRVRNGSEERSLAVGVSGLFMRGRTCEMC